MQLFLLESIPFFAVYLAVFFVLPGAIYVFYAIKWKKAQKENKGQTDIETWWDLVIEKEGEIQGRPSSDGRFFYERKKKWFFIMILSWVLGLMVLIGFMFAPGTTWPGCVLFGILI